ncbi:MAG: amino acid permease-associated region, partial [Clostridia bacterium]|nr:amino acid permease-associated region [Clostridia bacterium]
GEPILFKMPLHPISSYISLVFLVVVVVIMAFIPDLRFSLYIAPIWLFSLYIGFKLKTTAKKN